VRHLSAASAAILLQMAAMYLFSGLLKQNPAWQSGEALSHIFSFEAYARPWAEIPLRHPDLLRPLTRAVPWLEIVPAILLFSPWATIRLRVIALCLLAAFHLTIESLLATGLFQVVCLTGLILFLPTSFWDRLTAGTEAVDTPRRVPPRVAGRVADVAAQVVVLLLLAYVLTWNVAGLRLEDYWARERLGWAREHLGRREGKGLRILSRDAIVERMLGSFGGIGRLASLHQRWDMFYRSGEFEGGWHELVGTLGDGRRISVLEGGIPFRGENHPKPISPLALYPGTRWRVYLTYLRSPGTQVARDRFAAVASRDWNQRHPALSIDRLEIRFVQDRHRSSAGPERQTTVWFDGPVR
jgi:hypothetical protein